MTLEQTITITEIMQSRTILSIKERPGWCDLKLDEECVIYISDDGAQFWMKNDKYHREGGPAQIWPYGTKGWWLHGKILTPEGYRRRMEMKKSEISHVCARALEVCSQHFV